MACKISKHCISCTRGSNNNYSLKQMKSIVEDTKGTHWFCKYTKKQWNLLNDMDVIDVLNKSNLEKQYIKKYLKHVKKLGD